MRPGGRGAAVSAAAVLSASALLAAIRAVEPSLERADRIFVNGTVWTGEPDRPHAQALALRGNRILAAGTNGDVRALAGPATAVVDLQGRFVSPGFNDAHLHLLFVETVDLAGAADVREVQTRIAAYARANPQSSWITGRGWAYGSFPDGLPHRAQLDEVVSDRPAFMTGYDGHTGWANSRALAAAGITRDTPDPDQGVIVRDARGEPTGVLKESALALVRRLVPPPSDEEKYQALKRRLDEASSYGLTSVQNASALDLPIFERVLGEGGLKVRVYSALPFRKDLPAEELARYKALRDRYRGPLFKYGAVKGFVDGVVETGTAAMFEPYVVTPGTGLPNWTAADLDQTAAYYDREGFQIFLHAIGDKGIAMALDAYAHAARANGSSGRRHRVEHIEVPRLSDLPRFKALGVVASTQAIFANPDPNTTGVYAKNLGPEREMRAMPFKAIDDAGAVQPFGSDFPVFSMEVLPALYCAVMRRTPEGEPAGGWNPGQRIGAEAALRHFTRDAAWASFDEDVKGVLAPGKLADLVVLSHDILAGPPERILKARVLLTVMDGRDTFRAPELDAR
jgi:predicted amidohydrolase YtcJ